MKRMVDRWIIKSLVLLVVMREWRVAWVALLTMLGGKVKGIKVKCAAGVVEIIDGRSFISQYLEIFVRCGYDVQLKRQNPLIIDCGGNIGMSALRLRQRLPAAKIHVFEADRNIVDVLQRNVQGRDIVVSHACVWTRNGEIEFLPDNRDSGRIADVSEQGVKCPCIRLSDYIAEDVDLLKMDIEGAEFAVLTDLAATGKLSYIRNLVCEIHCTPSSREFADLLRALGESGLVFVLSSARIAGDYACGREQDQSPFVSIPVPVALIHLYAWRPSYAG